MDLGVGCDPDDDDASCAPVAFGDDQPDDVALMDNGDEGRGAPRPRARRDGQGARQGGAVHRHAEDGDGDRAHHPGEGDAERGGDGWRRRRPRRRRQRFANTDGGVGARYVLGRVLRGVRRDHGALGRCGELAGAGGGGDVRDHHHRGGAILVEEVRRERDAPFAADASDEESTPSRGGSSAKRRRKGEANGVIQVVRPMATDSIVTASGKKMKRGCLNCGQQKTPQWRVGPEGPKTLCNACGVRFRKGLPLDGP